jgi:hypothetical protein
MDPQVYTNTRNSAAIANPLFSGGCKTRAVLGGCK